MSRAHKVFLATAYPPPDLVSTMKYLFAVFLLAPIALLAQENPSYDPDYNGDGCYSVTDILGLLPLFGSCVEDDTTWACGDSALFDNYYYETVQIGTQCWFAENLRTMRYATGELLEDSAVDSLWHCDDIGAEIVYGEGNIETSNSSTSNEACAQIPCYDTIYNLASYGRLFNWIAVSDPRGLCPIGWRVSSSADWDTLTSFLSENGFPYPMETGYGLRANNGWPELSNDPMPGNGTDPFGFSAMPGGYIKRVPATPDIIAAGFNCPCHSFDQAGETAIWWAPNSNGQKGFTFTSGNSGYFGSFGEDGWPESIPLDYEQYGFSVRCVRDSL